MGMDGKAEATFLRTLTDTKEPKGEVWGKGVVITSIQPVA